MFLLIDNYDSFTYNLFQYMSMLGKKVVVKQNDEITVAEIAEMKPEKIVLSPGPSTTSNSGVCLEILSEFTGQLPIFGVCLGMQCMVVSLGGSIDITETVMHGKLSQVKHNNSGVFKNVSNPFEAMRYHSLASFDEILPSEFEITARSDDGVIMGLRSTKLKLEGVQFHPESLFTQQGMKILQNFVNYED